jgi:Cys-rich protein (TIGR01571 family)
LELGSLFTHNESIDEVDEPIIREEEAEEIEINSLDDNETCDYRINKAYLTTVLVLDALLCLWAYTVMFVSRARTAIREHHYIHGHPAEDCCVSCCCNCCALSQLAHETLCEDHGTRRLSNVGVSIGDIDDFLNKSNKERQHCYHPVFT